MIYADVSSIKLLRLRPITCIMHAATLNDESAGQVAFSLLLSLFSSLPGRGNDV